MQYPKQIRLGCSVLMGLLLAVSFDTVRAEEPSHTGIYLLSEVNGEPLPAATWSLVVNGADCVDQTIEGGLFLDAQGKAVAFVTDRQICVDDSGLEKAGEAVATIFDGSYEITGGKIAIHFEIFDDADQGVFDGDSLILTSVGVGDFKGQTSEFVFHKQ